MSEPAEKLEQMEKEAAAMKEAEEREKERAPQDVREETKEKVAKTVHIFQQEFKEAKTYEEKQRIVDKIHPPLHPQTAIDLIYQINLDRDKGLVFKILEKTEKAFGPEQTEKDGQCIFENVLMTPDTQLKFAEMLHEEGLENHIVPLLKHAASDKVREILLKKMRKPFNSEDDLFEAMKTTRNWGAMSLVLDHVKGGGLSAEMVERIKNSEEINAGLLGNIFKKMKTEWQSEESFKKSRPEAAVDKAVAKPAKSIWGKISGFFGRIWGGIKGALGMGPKAPPPAPPEAPPSTG